MQSNSGRKKLGRSYVYAVYISVFTALILLAFLSRIHIPFDRISVSHAIGILVFFDYFAIEFLVVLLVCSWMIRGPGILRIAAYLLTFVYMAVYAVQWTALTRGSDYITALALENVNHIELVLNAPIIVGAFVFLLTCAFMPYLIERRGPGVFSLKGHVILSAGVCFAMLASGTTAYWIPSSSLEARKRIVLANNMRHTSPAAALWKLFRPNRGSESDFTLVQQEALREARRFGLRVNFDRPFPMLRETIYSSPEPFPQREDGARQPNVIVFFSEGISARTINRYGSSYEGLTPNIDDFAKDAMVVENYFNHTAASYRGLLGQLCSIYPKFAGQGGWHTDYRYVPKVEYYCLPRYFGRNGYETVFFDAHVPEAAYVDELMTQIKFERVLTSRELKGYIRDEAPLMRDAMSDHQFMDSFVGFLKDREAQSGGRPFFYGLYNLGTHAWKKLSPDGIIYGDGKNYSLNTIHNWDDAFGRFWSYYRSSPYSKNTIVVFTADHCHYFEPQFVEAMRKEDPDYQTLFVDRIPLIIKDPTRDLPETYDARSATSIDFAPTLIHYLGAPNARNSFLGNSIFEPEREKSMPTGLSAIGEQTYVVEKNEVYFLGREPKHDRRIRLMGSLMNWLYSLEVNDRLWSDDLSR